jgi:DNA-binding MarR family transcriptional regulator
MDADERFAGQAAAMASELRVLLGKLSRRLRTEAASSDLAWPQKMVLTHLERGGPATVSALARIEGVRPQSMSATVAVLETAGLVQGAPDPADGRQTLLSLTPSCVEMLRAGRAAREDWLFRALTSKFSADEADELARALRLFARLVE